MSCTILYERLLKILIKMATPIGVVGLAVALVGLLFPWRPLDRSPEVILATSDLTSTLRLATTAPNLTEIVVAAGRGDQLVGRTAQCHYPPAVVAPLPIIGSFLRLDLEALVRARVQAVVVNPANHALHAVAIARVRAQSIVVEDQTVAAIENSILKLADPMQRKALIYQSQVRWRRVQYIQTQLRQRRAQPLRVLVIVWREQTISSARYYVVGRSAYFNDLLQMVHATNVAQTAPQDYLILTAESILRLHPDLILDLSYPAPAEALPAIPHIPVRALADPDLTIPGPRWFQTVEKLAKILAPLQVLPMRKWP